MSTSITKCAALCILVLQNSLHTLMFRYSRTISINGPPYLSTSVVFVSEILKFITSLAVLFCQSKYNLQRFSKDINTAVKPLELFKIAIPSGIYAVKNNLLFVALLYLDSVTFQTTYQLRVLTTVLFTMVMLKKSFTLQQWWSLFFLIIGVAMVQFPTESVAKPDVVWGNQLFGLFIMILVCLTSSFAGVYFELLLKEEKIPLWIRNMQMGGFGIIFSGIQMCWNDGEAISKYGILQGYNTAVVMVLLLQAYGGLLVTYVIKCADSIIKNFASSLAVIVSYLLAYLVLDEIHPTLLFTCGAGLVVTSTFMYVQKSHKSKSI